MTRIPACTRSTALSLAAQAPNAIVALAKRLQRNDPPDVWQTFAGKSLQAYASNGVVRSVASIFAREHLRRR